MTPDTDIAMAASARAAMHRRSLRARWHGAVYALGAAGLLSLYCQLYLGTVPAPYQHLMLLAGLLCHFVLGRYDLEADWALTRRGSVGRRLLAAWFGILTGLLLLGFATGHSDIYSRVVMIGWASSYPLLLLCINGLFRHLARRAPADAALRRSAVVVFANESSPRLIEALQESPIYRLGAVFQEEGPAGGARLAPVDGLLPYLQTHAVDAVFIMLSDAQSARAIALLEALRDCKLSVYVVPPLGLEGAASAELTQLEGVPMIRAYPAVQGADWRTVLGLPPARGARF